MHGVHPLPPSPRLPLRQALQHRLDGFLAAGRRLVVLGDFNISPAAADRAGATPRTFEPHRPDRLWLNTLLRRGGGRGRGRECQRREGEREGEEGGAEGGGRGPGRGGGGSNSVGDAEWGAAAAGGPAAAAAAAAAAVGAPATAGAAALWRLGSADLEAAAEDAEAEAEAAGSEEENGWWDGLRQAQAEAEVEAGAGGFLEAREERSASPGSDIGPGNEPGGSGGGGGGGGEGGGVAGGGGARSRPPQPQTAQALPPFVDTFRAFHPTRCVCVCACACACACACVGVGVR